MSEINADHILKSFREEIDRLDQEIVKLIAERFEVVHQVGETKAKHNLSPVQPRRMTEVLDRVSALASSHNLDADMVRDLYTRMIDHAHTLEYDIIGEEPDK